MKKLRSVVLWGVLVLIFGVVNLLIVQKETLISSGQTIFLDLAPVDPRSLIQGDYMALRYALVRDVPSSDLPKGGYLVLSLDASDIASFVRVHDSQVALAQEEVLIRYRERAGDIRLGAESFFFQEGHAQYYEDARYAELKLSDSGESVLVGLRGADLEPLGPPDSDGSQ